jgi:MYXO-CTERM domain-containing protein
MKNYLPTMVFAAAAAFLAGPRIAEGSTITLTGMGFYQSIPLIVNTTTSENATAGQIRVVVDGTNLVAFCVDLFTNIGFSTYNTTPVEPPDYPGGARAAWIYENYAPGVNSNVTAASLQLALWDVIHDGGDGLDAGNVRLSSSGSATLRLGAQTIILASAGHTSSNATIWRNVSFSGVPAQTLITSRINTPEPGTWLMTAAGLCLAAFGRRRRS